MNAQKNCDSYFSRQNEQEKEAVPENQKVEMIEGLSSDDKNLYDIICPLIGGFENNNGFKLKFHLKFKSRYPQIYWDSAGLIAYFNSIKHI